MAQGDDFVLNPAHRHPLLVPEYVPDVPLSTR